LGIYAYDVGIDGDGTWVHKEVKLLFKGVKVIFYFNGCIAKSFKRVVLTSKFF